MDRPIISEIVESETCALVHIPMTNYILVVIFDDKHNGMRQILNDVKNIVWNR